MDNHEQKQEAKKVKTQDSMGKINFFFSNMTFSPWAVVAMYFAYRISSKSTRKIIHNQFWNENTPRTHKGLKFDMLGVVGKLVKCVITCTKKELKKKLKIPSCGAQTSNNEFLVSWNFRD